MFTHNRPGIDLSGTWKFCPDPYQRCRQQQWWKQVGGDKSFFPCWDPAGLWDIQVPGTWKKQFRQLEWYDGHATYMRDFEAAPPTDGHEAFLVFDGVVYASEIYLNGHQVGRHDWGYSPFVCRVTDYLRSSNRLFVLVDNTLSPNRVPGVRFDWNNDGGIINGVKLIIVPRVYIENFRTQTRLDGQSVHVSVDVTINSADTAAQQRITVAIPELDLAATIEAAVGRPARVEFVVAREHIRLWSPQDPKLYDTVLKTEHEVIRDEIGYREIRTAGRDVLLNGKPLRLYGVCVHSEFPETGRTATPKGIADMIEHIRELGCNFVRCAHYPYSELWGRALDKAGLLWWQEVPVYWLPNIHEPHMTRLALGMLDETIRRDWNRAGLIIWSVSNECAGDAGHAFDLTGGNYPYWVKAVELVRQLDPSRLISSADSGHRRTLAANWSPETADAFATNFADDHWIPGHPDAFYELLDILAGNVYVLGPGDGLVAYHKFAAMLERYNKPLMISEFGGMSLRGADERPGISPDTLGSESRHIRTMREAYQSFRQLPQISGYMPWCLADVRVPMHWRWYNAGQAVFRYGLMDEQWRKKKVFAVVKSEIAALKERFQTGQTHDTVAPPGTERGQAIASARRSGQQTAPHRSPTNPDH